jgi:hypothetical protein
MNSCQYCIAILLEKVEIEYIYRTNVPYASACC